MTGHQYLAQVLSKQDVGLDARARLQTIRGQVEAVIRDAFGWTPRVYYGGSYAKHTMIAASYDLDVVVYFPATVGWNLSAIYWAVYGALQRAGYQPRQKDVAMRLDYGGGLHVDVVPGRALDDSFYRANLYRSAAESTLLTSIKRHLDVISSSNLRPTMRLLKLWALRNGVDVRSFVLELLAIRALSDQPAAGYDNQLWSVLTFIRDRVETVRLVDPANTNNLISDAITAQTKAQLAGRAAASLKAEYWEQIVW